MLVPNRIELPNNPKKYYWDANRVSIAQLRSILPNDVADENIHLVIDSGDEGYTDVYVQYFSEEPNPRYDNQLKWYEDSLIRYEKRMATYEKRMKTYLPQEAEYKEWLVKDSEVRKKANQEKINQRLKSLLKKLEKNK
jgi:hypothetical protein